MLYAPLDAETGGKDPKTSDILTLYIAIADENFMILEDLNLKLKPDTGLPRAEAEALKVNNINLQEHLASPDIITYSEAKKQIVAMLKRHHKKIGKYNNIKPFGQNVQFDLNFIWEHLIPKEEWDKLLHYKVTDTMPCGDFLKDAGWFPSDVGSLTSMVDFFNLPKGTAHTAKDDVLMTIAVYKKMLEMMKNNKGQSQDLISLLESE